MSQLDNNQTRNLNRLTYIAKRGRQKTPLHDLQKTVYHMEKEDVRTATRGTVIGEVAEKKRFLNSAGFNGEG